MQWFYRLICDMFIQVGTVFCGEYSVDMVKEGDVIEVESDYDIYKEDCKEYEELDCFYKGNFHIKVSIE